MARGSQDAVRHAKKVRKPTAEDTQIYSSVLSNTAAIHFVRSPAVHPRASPLSTPTLGVSCAGPQAVRQGGCRLRGGAARVAGEREGVLPGRTVAPAQQTLHGSARVCPARSRDREDQQSELLTRAPCWLALARPRALTPGGWVWPRLATVAEESGCSGTKAAQGNCSETGACARTVAHAAEGGAGITLRIVVARRRLRNAS